MSRFQCFIFLKRRIRDIYKWYMSTIKNGHIWLYYHFKKIIKGSGTSFQSPALSQKHVRNICHTAHQYQTKFHFDSTQDSKEITISVTFINIATPMMTSQILKYVNFTNKNAKIKISQERNMIFFFQIKKSLITHQGLPYYEK